MNRSFVTPKTQPETLRWSIRNVVAAGLAIACSMSSVFAQPSRNISRGAAVHRNVAPGVLSEVSFTTLPNAICTLALQGAEADAQHVLKLYSDDEGNVKFHIKPQANIDASSAQSLTAQFEATCQAGGQTVAHSIQLSPVADAQDPANPATVNANPRSGKGRVRPALKGDPMLFSSEELVAQGYPPRPDPTDAPEAYATWLHAVSKPTTIIDPKVITTDRFHGPANTIGSSIVTAPITVICCLFPTTSQESFNNWSGYSVKDGHQYTWVIGDWHVPSVSGEGAGFIGSQTDYSSFWVGLDGDGSSDVLQDGTEQEIETYSVLGITWTATNYYAWTEWYPLNEQQISNFPVNPGDEIYAYSYIGTNGALNINGNTGYFFMENLTSGHSVSLSTPIPKGVTFRGNSAEWVMERPSVNGNLTDLSDYHTANMSSAYMFRNGGSFMAYSAANNYQITMTDGSNTKLSTVSPTGSTTMSFSWWSFK